MPKRVYEIKNFKGVVKDVAFGNQPEGTLNDMNNFVLDKQNGSLVTRNGYTSGLTAPSTLTELNYHLTKPVGDVNYHIYCGKKVDTNKYIWVKPYYHNSTTAGTDDSGWALLSDNLGINILDLNTLSGVAKTITINNASTNFTYTTSNYYKNWTVVLTDGSQNSEKYLITAFSVAANVATLTLDRVYSDLTSANWIIGDIAQMDVIRFGHAVTPAWNDKFYPSYITPSSYSNDKAIRFSGDATDSQVYKNVWYGLVNRTFFPSDNTNKYTFTESYADYAECKAPLSVLLKSSSTSQSTSNFIKDQIDYDFIGNISSTKWAAHGNQTAQIIDVNIDGISTRALRITSSGDGDSSANYVDLNTSGINSFVNGTDYEVTLKLFLQGAFEGSLTYFGGYIASGANNKTQYKLAGNGGEAVNQNDALYTYNNFLTITAGANAAPTIRIWTNATQSTSPNAQLHILGISISAVGGGIIKNELPINKTYNIYGTYVYDGYQESELMFLDRKYIQEKFSVYNVVLRQNLGTLNKRITGCRIYVGIDDYDTTLNDTSKRLSPAFLIKDISFVDSTSSWSKNSTTGYFEYTLSITKQDIDSVQVTWEQKTNRDVSTATTISCSLYEQSAGRIFAAQWNGNNNILRYTCINGDGVPCEDIFPSSEADFQTKIVSGAGNVIKELIEYEGNLIVYKEKSRLLLTTSDPHDLWKLKVIDNTAGAYNQNVAQKISGYIIDADENDVYIWNGGIVRSMFDGVFRKYWQTQVGSGMYSWIDPVDKTYNILPQSISPSTGKTYFKIKIGELPTIQTLTHRADNVVSVKDGSIYFSNSTGASYLFNTSLQDNGSNFDVMFDTGNIVPERNAFINLDEFHIDFILSGTVSVQPTITIYIDGSSFQTYSNVTLTNSGNTYLRRKIKAHQKARSFRLVMSGLKVNNLTSIPYVGIKYSIQEEFGDVRTL